MKIKILDKRLSFNSAIATSKATATVTAILALGLTFSSFFMACGNKHERKVYFGNLENNAQVESPFKVIMKAENLIVEPASMGIRDGAGHFHILINKPLSPSGAPIPKDADHIHYGAGDSETTLDLPVGEHTLVLQFAKGDHIPYEPSLDQQIRITVTKQNKVETAEISAMDSATAAVADSNRVIVDSNQVGIDSVKMDSTK